MKQKSWLFRTATLLIALSLLLGGCKPQVAQEQLSNDTPYTVTVKTDDGNPAPDVDVFIYVGDPSGELVAFDTTDENGVMTFTAGQSSALVAVLEGIPAGYDAEPSYPITGQSTEILLSLGVMTEDDMKNTVYKLGDRMLDFTVTDVTGAEHTLSQLLKTKKAIVLNFWYLDCEPCEKEAPCLQEAYSQYSQDVAVLALNPEPNQDVEKILAYMEAQGITYPMAVVDALWKDMMGLAGYPTTVVIDRTGTICLIHEGAIESADTFCQVFDYFTAEDYESRPIENIQDILTESDLGTRENPHQTDASRQFTITVKPGQTYYLHLYKQVEKFYLNVSGGSFTIRYDGRDYASEGGSLSLFIVPEGAFVPVELEITNTSQEEQTYTISKGNPRGSYSNPYSMTLGEFDTKVSAGNSQGVYYTYYMAEDGTLRVTCLQATAGVEYDFTLYNLNSYAQNTLETAGETDEDGNPYLEITGRKGQNIQFIINTLPDGSNSYPACNFKLLAELNAGALEEKYEPPVQDYTITVLDQDGSPMQNVSLLLTGDFIHTRPLEEGEELPEGQEPETYPIQVSETLVTDEAGVATTSQVVGPYTVTVDLPEGYKAEATQYPLTEEAPVITVTLKKIVQKDYTVTLQYPDGTAVPGVNVMLGADYKTTDDTGSVSFHLDEDTYTVTILGVPEGYVLPEKKDTFTFPEGQTSLALTLVGIGGKENPYLADALPFTTKTLAPGETIYIRITAPMDYADAPVLTVANADATITIGETAYIPVEGVVTVPLTEENTELGICHSGEANQSLTLNLAYPIGTKGNPQPIDSLENVVLQAPEGAVNGYYYAYTNENAGTLTLQLAQAPEGYAVTATTSTSGTVTVTDTPATVYQKLEEATILHIGATADTCPAVTATLNGSLEIDWTAVPQGQKIYTVTVTKPDDTGMASAVVQFKKDGNVAATAMTDAQGVARTMLEAGIYSVELVLPSAETKYYYEGKTASFALGVYELTIRLVSNTPSTTNLTASTLRPIGAVPILEEGTTYLTLQSDIWRYYAFKVTQAGTYRISVSDPDALIVDCKTTNYILAPGKAGAASPVRSFDKSISASQALGTTFVIAVSGTEDTLLSITRIGDQGFDPATAPPDESWKSGYVPTASAVPARVTNPKYVDIMDMTPDLYVPVYNETDQFWHMGSADGPIIYVDLNDSGNGYASIKTQAMPAEGASEGGGSFSRYFNDPLTGKPIRREVYGDTIIAYVQACKDAGKADGSRFYPLTDDLMHILKTGCAPWWEDPNEFYYDNFQGANPDIVWMFACCTFG